MSKIFIFYTVIFYLSYFIFNNWKFLNNKLLDKETSKVQSFHEIATPRSGGVLIFVIWFFFLIFNKFIYIEIPFLIYFTLTNFLIGFFADLKIIKSPIKRFCLMLLFNLIIIFYYDFHINQFDFYFLDFLNSFLFFKIILVFLALFFIINGSNLIDGFNGLLSIHITIIIFIIYLVCKNNNINVNLQYYLMFLIFGNILFLSLNFPKAKIFLGDCGAYFLGAQIACISIYISNSYDLISTFFIANILFYLFFEIFFSVFRKILQKKNPFYPDGNHLHMLLFKFIKNKTKFSNPLTSIIINLVFILSLIPSYVYFNNDLVCKIIFVIQIFVYISSYLFLIKSKTNANIHS